LEEGGPDSCRENDAIFDWGWRSHTPLEGKGTRARAGFGRMENFLHAKEKSSKQQQQSGFETGGGRKRGENRRNGSLKGRGGEKKKRLHISAPLPGTISKEETNSKT